MKQNKTRVISTELRLNQTARYTSLRRRGLRRNRHHGFAAAADAHKNISRLALAVAEWHVATPVYIRNPSYITAVWSSPPVEPSLLKCSEIALVVRSSGARSGPSNLKPDKNSDKCRALKGMPFRAEQPMVVRCMPLTLDRHHLSQAHPTPKRIQLNFRNRPALPFLRVGKAPTEPFPPP